MIDDTEIRLIERKLLWRFSRSRVIAFMRTEVADYFSDGFEDSFNKEGRGDTWEPLASITKKEKDRLGYGGKGILIREGNLKDMVSGFHGDISIDGEGVILTMPGDSDKTDVKYGAHQLGKGQPGQRLPQRKMVEIVGKDGPEILKLATAYFMRPM